jgi:hypothetical protein
VTPSGWFDGDRLSASLLRGTTGAAR